MVDDSVAWMDVSLVVEMAVESVVEKVVQ